MIQRLEETEYARIRPLFDGLRYNLVIDSVIDGNTRAWVYADDVSCPRSAFMWNRQDAMLLAGDVDNDEFNRALDRLITEEIIPDARERYIPHLSLHYFPQAWESRAGVILRDKHAVKARRRFYTLADPKVDWRADLRPGYTTCSGWTTGSWQERTSRTSTRCWVGSSLSGTLPGISPARDSASA
jgi:hypothetical protein